MKATENQQLLNKLARRMGTIMSSLQSTVLISDHVISLDHATTPDLGRASFSPPGRSVDGDEFKRRELVTKRWMYFKDNYKTLGYARASFELFAGWADGEYDDMPSDDPRSLKRMISTHRRTPTPQIKR